MQINSQKIKDTSPSEYNEFLFSSDIKKFEQLKENINRHLKHLNEKIKSIVEKNYENYNSQKNINSLSKEDTKK